MSISTGAMVAIGCGLIVYFWNKIKIKRFRLALVLIGLIVPLIFALRQGDFQASGRISAWKRTISLSLKNPVGYGIGTYKLLFPLMSQDLPSTIISNQEKWKYDNTEGKGLAWRRAHNDPLQILFEVGFPGAILLLGWLISVFLKCYKDPLKLTGLVIVGTNMMTHFPVRMCQSVLIILMFLAWCEFKGEK